MSATSSTSPYPTLFSPITLNRVTIKNRIVSTAHATGYAIDGYPKEKYRRYYERKARGGVGLIITFGSCSVHPTSSVAEWNGVANWDDSVIPDLAAMAEVAHRHGAKIFCQITHMGRRGVSTTSSRPLLAPSPISEPAHRERPKEIEVHEIQEIVGAFAAAAERLKRAGFDGAEITSYGGHLIEQFWAPHVNKRTDDYGGSLTNRMRFSVEVIDAVRESVGPDFCVGFRMTGDQLVKGGLNHDDMKEIAARLADLHKLDFFNISGATAETAELQAMTVPSLDYPLGLFNRYAAAMREIVGVPVIAASRIVEPGMAEAALRQGVADLVGMTRSLIADPDLPRKAESGENDEIRLCTGANEGCIGRLYQGLQIRCVQNPLIGHEDELDAIEPAASPRRVVVVGGGPGGMEAARVAALRGHDVILYEATSNLGGQVRAAAATPNRAEYGRSINWLSHQIDKLGVDVQYSTRASMETILATNPDAVVVATGSTPRPATFPIDVRARIATCDDILLQRNRSTPGSRCVVIDEDAHMRGPGAAEALLNAGAHVEIVTRELLVGLDVDPTLKPRLYRRLSEKGAAMTTLTGVVEVTLDGVLVEHIYSGQRRLIPADLVVLALGGEARDELYFDLKHAAPSLEVHRVGDCVAPRQLYDALLEATRTARLL
ncbi:MAG: dimethylglycine catabolism [Thermomicrobiales bacterium]|nr:dimethylglycine catabolism [Thermomicrobiales bacterium]